MGDQAWHNIWPELGVVVLFRADRILHEVQASFAERLALTVWHYGHYIGDHSESLPTHLHRNTWQRIERLSRQGICAQFSGGGFKQQTPGGVPMVEYGNLGMPPSQRQMAEGTKPSSRKGASTPQMTISGSTKLGLTSLRSAA